MSHKQSFMEKASEPKIFSLSDLPKRPKPGDTNHGAKQSFITNYYKISFNQKNQMFYQFEMTFEPEIPKDSRGAIRAALKSCHKQLEQKIGYYVPRGTMIWTFRPPEAALSFKCNITSTGKDSSSYDYILHLKKTREFSLNNMHSGNKDAQQVLQVLNSQLKKTLQAVNMIEIGRNSKYYNPKYINQNRVDGSRLKVWRGFTTSIQIISGIAYLMVDVSTRVLRDESLLETIQRLNKDEVNDLVGATILAQYGNYRTYKIEAFDYKRGPQSTFDKNGEKVTFKEYFKKAYNVSIKDNDQPLIITSITKKQINKDGTIKEIRDEICLLPELVCLTGMTDEQRADRNLMQNLSRFTKLAPANRIDENQDLLSLEGICKNQIFSVSQQQSMMNGYILNPPVLSLKDTDLRPNNGQLRVQNKILNPAVIKDWLILYTDRRDQDLQDFENFLRTMKEASKALGIQVTDPGICRTDGSYKSFEEKIEKDFERNGKPTICVTLLANNQAKHYTKLKQLLYNKWGVPHQNVLKRSMFKNAMSVVSNILLQINAKMGLPLWRVERNHKQLRNRKMAIGGLAIYHKLINKNESCAAFVGSTDHDLSTYYSFAKLMPQNTQRVDSLHEMMIGWLRSYFKKNKDLPELLLLYRDGVGEGQIKGIIDVQMPALRRAVETAAGKVKPGYNPEIAFLLAVKKVPQRIFELNTGQRGRGDKGQNKILNPTSGSVIGAPLSRYSFDFFLVPQYVNQGTATPTHYIVVHNTTKLSEEALQTITYEQCYNYFNWQGAVRIPGALMYANKLATIVGEHLKKAPTDDNLKDKLYSL